MIIPKGEVVMITVGDEKEGVVGVYYVDVEFDCDEEWTDYRHEVENKSQKDDIIRIVPTVDGLVKKLMCLGKIRRYAAISRVWNFGPGMKHCLMPF